MSYPPKHPKNGTRHYPDHDDRNDHWPGDTTTDMFGNTWRLGRDGETWEVIRYAEKSVCSG